MTALALSASAALAQSAIPFLYAPLVPGVKLPGSASFTLTVYGTGFASDAVVSWNGAALATTFVKSSELTATVTAADLTTAETGLVTVSNGGVASNVDYFQVVKGGYTVGYSKLDDATDLTPSDVTAASFRNNGDNDLAVATGDNTISVLLGNGNGTFQAHAEYPVPGHPSAIIHGDFNGDGKVDLATADPYTNEISVLLGNGDGTFQTHQEYATGTEPVALATADVNGDGKLDIVVVNLKADTVSVLLGNGDGTFKPHVDYATGNGPTGLAIGDFNGDGALDLAVVNNIDNSVSILLGSTSDKGTFGGAVAYPAATGANSIVVGDFTSTNVLGLAVGTSNKEVAVLLGNGNGTFQSFVVYPIGADAIALATADVNADGKLDLISANYNDDTVSVLLGNGNGTFKAESIYPTSAGPSGLAIGDFNNDGKLDIATANFTANTVSVLTDSVISITPTIVGFGTNTSGYSYASKPFTLKNSGTSAYTVGSIGWIGTDAADFTTTSNTCNAGTTVPAGKTCTFTVTFSPQASETANAQMTITAPDGSIYALQAMGVGNIPINLTPRNMTFPGWQLIGTTTTGMVDTFTNESGVDLYFTLIELTGQNENEFSFTTTCAGGGNDYSVPLGPQAECASTVYFTPNTSGPAHVTQVYYGTYTENKEGLLISGQATAVKVTPPTLTFANTPIGSTSTGVVTFQNAGSTPMEISSAYFANGTANVFTIQSNTCNFVAGVGGSVPANTTCTFTLAFTPTVVGTESATFTIGDADPAPAPTVTVGGVGQAAAVSANRK